MKLKFLLHNRTEGIITVEIAVCSFAVIMLFALFFTITGYCRAYLTVKEYTDTKIRDTAVFGYAAGFYVPGIISTADFRTKQELQIKNLIIFNESWGDEIKFNSSYTYVSLLGNFRVKMSSYFTRWAGDMPKSDKVVWDMSPIERGKAIEAVFGGGLPEFFPVIDAYDEISGKAASIVSIDTTLAYYKSGTQIKNLIFEKTKELAEFEYGAYQDVYISKKDIESRELIVVIPENQINDEQNEALMDCMGLANENNILMTVKRFQYAKKILPDNGSDSWDFD